MVSHPAPAPGLTVATHHVFDLYQSELDNLLFTNPTYSNGHSNPSTILSNITALSSQIAYSEDINGNITTLSTNYVGTPDGVVQGLLYVPDLESDDPCYGLAKDYIPANVTRQKNLPNTNYNSIALAPWINANCTSSFLTAAGSDPLRGMLFYLPDGDAASPPKAESEVWDLNDGEEWKDHHYPVYAIPGASGNEMMRQLSFYSGDLADVPFADQINATYSPNPADYVRVWTELTVSTGPAVLELWVLVLIIIGVLLVVIGGTSLLMHYVQSRRRATLRRRVTRGEVNLEALGIKRLTVPPDHILTFPLFTYNYDPPLSSPTSIQSPQSPISKLPEASSKAISGSIGKGHFPLEYQPTCLICLDDYESKATIIRELSCGHIFHPDCIDEFLSEVSSLCPLCKASMLPPGYCPRITNSMVRREFGTRRLRSSGINSPDIESGCRRLSSWSTLKERLFRISPSAPNPITSVRLQDQHPITRSSAVATMTPRERMQELADSIDETNSDDGRPRWKRTAVKVFPGFR
ncbi:Uu.00g032910.m01.CDS01 [Anthostomella pinea]|uniref:Uu.00g032910.m01.CDS01 n=1 Tax=Anthostomella pinea TaxID=933095 RepID=A0AAI8V3W4_9PEZI|nr:Uu.00g032910.m01.CDS01 [Anthostomella pinea]